MRPVAGFLLTLIFASPLLAQSTATLQGRAFDASDAVIPGATVTVLLVLESGLIALLLVQRSRRRRTEARNSAILRALPDLMFLQTTDGVYVDYHASDPGQLLRPPEQFLGKNMRDVLPPGSAPPDRGRIRAGDQRRGAG